MTKIRIDLFKVEVKLSSDVLVGKSASSSHDSNGSDMKLPKMYMNKFNGDPLNWKTFYN